MVVNLDIQVRRLRHRLQHVQDGTNCKHQYRAGSVCVMMSTVIVGVMIVRVMTVHVIVIAGHSGLLLLLHRRRRILGHLPIGRLQVLSMMSEGSVWIDILPGRLLQLHHLILRILIMWHACVCVRQVFVMLDRSRR
jgi:hypothetical protein